MPPDVQVTMQAASDAVALAWAMQRHSNYLAGTGTSAALSEGLRPLLAVAWAYIAMMHVLVP